MRRQHRKDGYQFLSGLNLGNTGLVVAVAGILLTLFLMSNILPLVDEPENREYCEMVRILYDLDERPLFSRPDTPPVNRKLAAPVWTPYRELADYAHDLPRVPTPKGKPEAFSGAHKGLGYETADGIRVSISRRSNNVRKNIDDLLNPETRRLVSEKPLFTWLRESLGRHTQEFDCKKINTPQTLAMLIASAVRLEGADRVEVFELTAIDALLLKRYYRDRVRLELLFQDLAAPDDGLLMVRMDAEMERLNSYADRLVTSWR